MPPEKSSRKGDVKLTIPLEMKMMKIPKREDTLEFKELTAKRVKPDQLIGAVAKDIGLIEQTLRNWVKAADARKLNSASDKVVTPEQMELSRLRAENIEVLYNRKRLHSALCYKSLVQPLKDWLCSQPQEK